MARACDAPLRCRFVPTGKAEAGELEVVVAGRRALRPRSSGAVRGTVPDALLFGYLR
jgi:hypothetical protein